MKNLDLIQAARNEILQRMSKAITEGNTDEYAQAFNELAESIQNAVIGEYNQAINARDTAVLAQRGIRQLTSEETKYYQSVIDAMKAKDPQQAVTLIDDVMPKTVFDEIFTYLTENHPLLDAINFQSTGAITQWMMSTSSGIAGWGELNDTIKNELAGAFSVIELGKCKLSAFIPVCQAMLDLGPVWLDSYVRTILAEAIAVGLETAIVDGDGKNKPIGMTRKLSGAVDGVYPKKDATVIKAFNPVTYGAILNTLSQAPNGKRRAITNVLLVVNPTDYFTKVFPATTVRTTDGGFNSNVFPFPTTVIQSAAVQSGKAVIGLGDKYFMGLGTGTGKGGKIEFSDEVKFIEDQRVYKIKLYGNGQAMDENAFLLLDISGVEATVLDVNVVNAAEIGTV